MFSALSENHGNLNSKIKLFVSFAGVVSLNHGKPQSKNSKIFLDNVANYVKMFRMYAYGPTLLK